jgi:hypothetical protein
MSPLSGDFDWHSVGIDQNIKNNPHTVIRYTALWGLAQPKIVQNFKMTKFKIVLKKMSRNSNQIKTIFSATG